MGRTKGSKNKNSHASSHAKSNSKNYESKNITSLITCFVGVFLGVIMYINADGKISKYISDIFGGLFGNIKLLIPVVVLAIGIYGVINGKKYIKSKLVQSYLLFSILSGFLSWKNYSFNSNIDLNENIKIFYENGVLLKDGGFMGGIIAAPLYQWFGKIPALIVLIALFSIMFILITGIMPKTILLAIKNFFARLFGLIIDNETPEKKMSKKEEKLSYVKTEKENTKERKPMFDSQISFDFLGKNSKDKNDDIKDIQVKSEPVIKQNEDKVGDLSEIFKVKTKEQILKEKEEMQKKEELRISHSEIEKHEETYVFPSLELLDKNISDNKKESSAEMKATAQKLQKTLNSFGVDAKVVDASRGPSITRYEIQPNIGVKVSKIVSLADDIALNLAASNIRIEAPIPGKAAVGIELPNKVNDIVTLRSLIESSEFQTASSKTSYALGKDVAGDIVISDISKMPHMLISGATGSGKSVCINTMITSILYKAKPSEVKLLMIDPKVVELGIYNGIPHLLIPVVTDPKKAAGALNWAVQEMVSRYNLFAGRGVKDIKGYNELLKKENEPGILPQIVIIIDELADLMMVAANEVEDAICRLAQMARAAGMYLVIATQRPSVDVITGIIKANIPSRIAFAVSSQIDSRTILDSAGAEKLLGKGDMLYYPTGKSKPVRLQGAYVSEKEIESIVSFIKSNQTANYDDDIIDKIENSDKVPSPDGNNDGDADDLLPQAIDLVVELGTASTSMIQRRFKVGYARAGRIVDQMEARGIISGYDGSKPRQVLISKEELQEIKMGTNIESKAEETTVKENIVNEESIKKETSDFNNPIADELDIQKKKSSSNISDDDIDVYAVDGDYE